MEDCICQTKLGKDARHWFQKGQRNPAPGNLICRPCLNNQAYSCISLTGFPTDHTPGL